MKQIFTLSLVLFSFTVFSQQNAASKQSSAKELTKPQSSPQTTEVPSENPRTAATSAQSRTSEPVKPPYDVNDKYMGRKNEFLGNLIVAELPADFPVYEKQWSLREYNQVVTAFYYNHLDIVKEKVKNKLAHLEH